LRLLITGGAGFIGSNYIRYVLDKHPDYQVINFDQLTYAGNLENLKDVEKNRSYSFVRGDITDARAVERAMEGIDAVLNFAAESHVDRSILSPDEFVLTNVLGVNALLKVARDKGVKRFVQISTDEVYGSILEGSFKEDDCLRPSSPYSASKAGGDLLAFSYWVTHRFPVIITRSSNNFGPYQYPEKVIPLFITNALEGKPLPLYGDGLNVRDWLYVIDNCEAIDLVLLRGKEGEIYNIGAGNEFTNLELTKRILQLLGKPETLIECVKDRPGHDRRYSIDNSKIRSLGWRPKYEFGEALEETIRWYENNIDWWKKLKS
jgi:dTDP-glucose 4,6-dehydratase